MRASRFAGRLTRLTGLGGAVALIVATGTPLASASSATGWKISSTIGSASSEVNNGGIVVTGPTNAWATWTCGPCPSGTQPNQNLMQHWDGTSWVTVNLPSQLQYPTVITGEQASSAKNFWVFTNNNTADVYNGSSWTQQALPTWVERPISGSDVALASAVFSATNVWAFSVDAASNPTLAGHYTGGKWHKVQLPVAPNEVEGLAPNDIWVYGFAAGNGPRTLANWNGTSWQTVSLPTVTNGTLVASEMVALGPTSVWLAGEFFPTSGKVRSELLQWNGSQWTTTDVPSSVGIVNQFASDGGSGFWVIATHTTSGGVSETRFAHDTGGQWTTYSIPTKDKLTSEPGVLASVPGSQDMWSLGFLVSGSTSEYGEILDYTG